MGRLRTLSGIQVATILRAFGFASHSQQGSHLKLRRVTGNGERQTLIIPLHAELDRGTLNAIFRQASRYIPPTDLKPHFFHEG